MTTADNATVRQDAAREGLLARYPLTFYFLIAYGFSWLVWVLLALSAHFSQKETKEAKIG